jgi:TonB family protein
VIGKDGTVQSARRLNRQVDDRLADAAMEAVKQWVYQSTLLNGEPVEVMADVDVNFTLSEKSAAAQPFFGGVFRIGDGVSAPRPIFKVEPEYSEQARAIGYQGRVMLETEIDEAGTPRNIRVLRSLGMGLDEKAVEALSKWKFAPGQKEGTPVRVYAVVEMDFRLLNQPKTVAPAAQPQASRSAEAPPANESRSGLRAEPPKRISTGGPVQASRIVRRVPPVYPPEAKAEGIEGLVEFDAVIGVDGAIISLSVLSGHPQLAKAAQEAVRQWVYQPTLLNGVPVEVQTRIDVNFTLQR